MKGVVTVGNKERALLLRGLPFRVSAEEVIAFFAEFGPHHHSDIIIEERNAHGKRTGAALIFFENGAKAQGAKLKLNGQHIGSRYVEMFDCEDALMQ